MKNFSSSLICSFFLIALIFSACPSAFGAESVKFESEIKDGLSMPVDAAFNASGQLFIFDAGKSVIAFDEQGKPQLTIATNNPQSDAGQSSLVSSMAISSAGLLAITDPTNSRVKVFNLAGEALFSFGVEGNLPGQFKSLSAVKIDGQGFFYTADRSNKRLQIFSPNGIFVRSIDLDAEVVDVALDLRGNIYALLPEIGKIEKFTFDGKKVSEINCKAGGKDQIQKSSHLQVDAWGNIYLTQSKEERIVKIDPSGNVLISFGSQGNGRGQFLGIGGLAVDESGRVYVTDSANARVQVFKVTGSVKSQLAKAATSQLFVDFESTLDATENISDIFSLPGKGLFSVSDKKSQLGVWNGPSLTLSAPGSGAGELSSPTAIYVTLDSRIYVADTANHRVEIFNYDGTLNYEFGKNGNKPGQFNSLQGIVVNRKGMIYVADTLNNRIQVFNQDGIYLSMIGQEEPDADDKTVDECQKLNLPKVLAIDTKDRLYVVDADTKQVKIFDENGACVKTIKQSGVGEFKKIVDIAVDPNDNLYVADASDGHIEIFDPTGKFLLSFGCLGTGRGYFQQLSSIAVSEGRIFVADYQSNQIQVFKYLPDGLIGKLQRLDTTKTASPVPNAENNEVLRYTMARDNAYEQATKEFADSLGFSREYLLRFVRIDSVESLNDGQIKVTISIPKFIPREIKFGERPLLKSGG